MRQSDSITNLAKALNAAQQQIKGAVKDSSNPFFKSRYADLESVMDALQPIYVHGLSYVQMTDVTDSGDAVVVTRIMHNSGEWIEGRYPIITKQDRDPQAFGSGVTYARRYALSAAFGVASVDDDAEHAMARSAPKVVSGAHREVEVAKARQEPSGFAKTPEEVQAALFAKTGKAAPVERLMAATVKPKTVGAEIPKHEHLWAPSQFGEGREYCKVCKLTRPADRIL